VSFRSLRYRLSKLGITGADVAGEAATRPHHQRTADFSDVACDRPPNLASRRLVAIGLLLLGLSAIAWICQSRANTQHDRWPPEADTFYLPPSKMLKLASLGHSELAAT